MGRGDFNTGRHGADDGDAIHRPAAQGGHSDDYRGGPDSAGVHRRTLRGLHPAPHGDSQRRGGNSNGSWFWLEVMEAPMDSISHWLNAVFAETGAWFFFYVLGGVTGRPLYDWVMSKVRK